VTTLSAVTAAIQTATMIECLFFMWWWWLREPHVLTNCGGVMQ
jgi:hypothetical protein